MAETAGLPSQTCQALRATTTYYDSWFRAYKVCETNAKGHKQRTAYYGVGGNGSCSTESGSTTSLAGRFGQPEKQWDSMDVMTQYLADDRRNTVTSWVQLWSGSCRMGLRGG